MERMGNSTASSPTSRQVALPPSSLGPHADTRDGNAYLYVLIVMCFYGVFLCGIMFGYFRSKRREKKRVNVFTRLVHEEEQREWGALPKRPSLTLAAPGPGPAPAPASASAAVSGLRALHFPFCGNPGNHFAHLRSEDALPVSAPLATCASCAEQSSVSSLCSSSADTRLAIEEEESDSGTAEGPEENPKGGSETSGDDTG